MKNRILSVIFASILLASCSHKTSNKHNVVVIGDSLTAISTDKWNTNLSQKYNITINGLSGARTDQRQESAAGLAANDPGQVVIELGTNDLGQKQDPEYVKSQIRQMADKFPNAECIHFVTVNESIFDEQFNANSKSVNDWARTQFRTIEWAKTLKENQANLTLDLVHPNDEGQQVLSDLIEKSLDEC